MAALLALVKRLMKSAFRVDLGSISTDDNSPYSWSAAFVLMATNNSCAAGCGAASSQKKKMSTFEVVMRPNRQVQRRSHVWGLRCTEATALKHRPCFHRIQYNGGAAKIRDISGNVTLSPSSTGTSSLAFLQIKAGSECTTLQNPQKNKSCCVQTRPCIWMKSLQSETSKRNNQADEMATSEDGA